MKNLTKGYHYFVVFSIYSTLGSMFSILASVESFFALMSTVAWPNIYNVVINHNLSPGTTFKIMAGVTLFAVLPLM